MHRKQPGLFVLNQNNRVSFLFYSSSWWRRCCAKFEFFNINLSLNLCELNGDHVNTQLLNKTRFIPNDKNIDATNSESKHTERCSVQGLFLLATWNIKEVLLLSSILGHCALNVISYKCITFLQCWSYLFCIHLESVYLLWNISIECIGLKLGSFVFCYLCPILPIVHYSLIWVPCVSTRILLDCWREAHMLCL